MTTASAPPQPNLFGHDYSAGYRSREGYAVCCQCGARENTDRAAKDCGANADAERLDLAWGLIANAWTIVEQADEWPDLRKTWLAAAEKWRDDYLKSLPEVGPMAELPDPSKEAT